MTGLQPLPSVNPHVVFQLLLLGEHNLEENKIGCILKILILKILKIPT